MSDLFSIGPNDGSSSSWIFCNRTGVPNCTEFSSVLRKSGIWRSIIFKFCNEITFDRGNPVSSGHGMQNLIMKISLVSNWQLLCCMVIINLIWQGLTLCFSIFLIHFMACPWGSIMRGHRLLLVTITPFSVEKASEGRPWMFQSRTAVGLARKLANEKSGVHGICNSRTCSKKKKKIGWRGLIHLARLWLEGSSRKNLIH